MPSWGSTRMLWQRIGRATGSEAVKRFVAAVMEERTAQGELAAGQLARFDLPLATGQGLIAIHKAIKVTRQEPSPLRAQVLPSASLGG